MSKKELMKYSTINKLKKENLLDPSEMLGQKLTSEKALDLYKNNIRIHHKHYVPKDLKKYFHSHEIEGGALNLNKAFKKLGSKVKHTFENIGNKTANITEASVNTLQNTANTIAKKGEEYFDTVIHGRNDYPPKVRNIISKYGEKTIKSIVVDRTPVPSAITGALNVVSMGAFSKRLGRTPYDKLFHLRIDITFTDGYVIALEKNEVINSYERPKKLKGGEQEVINNIPSDLTLNDLLEGGKRIQGSKFFSYSASSNNCQDFIISLLKGSNIGTSEDYEFIKQNTSSLFKGDSFLRKVANTATDLGGKVNEITTGAGVCNQYDASSSDDDSDDSIVGNGFKREKSILKKMKQINDEIEEHQHIHGGKIKIGLAFKKLGSTIKKGYEPTLHIDINSHNINKKSKQKNNVKERRTAKDELIINNRKREERSLRDALHLMASDINKEKHPIIPPKYSQPLGSGFKKGSIEAKEHMAKIRSMRKN